MQEEDLKTYVYRIIPEKELTACVCPDKMKVKGLTKREGKRCEGNCAPCIPLIALPQTLTIVQGKLWFSNRHKLYVMSGEERKTF